jgi:hypothetical protein
MIAGDSISQGLEGDWTWRYRLWQWFQAQNIDVDFVGPFSGTKPPAAPAPPSVPPLQGSPTPPPPLRPTGRYAVGVDPAFNGASFAMWGRQVAQDAPVIEDQVAMYHPDMLLVELGFNDLGWFVTDPAGTLANMATLVNHARAANPNLKFAIANVPQRTLLGSANPDLPAKTDTYDQILATAIPTWSTSNSPVALVNFRDSYSCGVSGCPAGYDAQGMSARRIGSTLQCVFPRPWPTRWR